MKSWVKAGLLGGILGIALTMPAFLIFFLPLNISIVITTCASGLFFLLYPGVGILAAFWSPLPRTQKQGAIDGALAGLVAFSLDSLVTLVLMVIFVLTGIFEQYVFQFVPWAPPEVLRTATISTTLIFLPITLCINMLTGIIFSAIGGLVFASIKKE